MLVKFIFLFLSNCTFVFCKQYLCPVLQFLLLLFFFPLSPSSWSVWNLWKGPLRSLMKLGRRSFLKWLEVLEVVKYLVRDQVCRFLLSSIWIAVEEVVFFLMFAWSCIVFTILLFTYARSCLNFKWGHFTSSGGLVLFYFFMLGLLPFINNMAYDLFCYSASFCMFFSLAMASFLFYC